MLNGVKITDHFRRKTCKKKYRSAIWLQVVLTKEHTRTKDEGFTDFYAATHKKSNLISAVSSNISMCAHRDLNGFKTQANLNGVKDDMLGNFINMFLVKSYIRSILCSLFRITPSNNREIFMER